MASFSKFNSFVSDLAQKVHNLNADALKRTRAAASVSVKSPARFSCTYCSARWIRRCSLGRAGGLNRGLDSVRAAIAIVEAVRAAR